MSEAKHTPGWELTLDGEINVVLVRDATGHLLYEGFARDPEHVANARLIAAAPELLAALEAAEPIIPYDRRITIENAKAAIKKATS